MDALPIGDIGRWMERGNQTRVFIGHAGDRRHHSDKQRNAFSFEIPVPEEWGRMNDAEKDDYVKQFIRTVLAVLDRVGWHTNALGL